MCYETAKRDTVVGRCLNWSASVFSLEKPLLERFDGLIRERQYTNRSEALRT